LRARCHVAREPQNKETAGKRKFNHQEDKLRVSSRGTDHRGRRGIVEGSGAARSGQDINV
jgi:hypothetical protein